jgi:hypothetical protein
MTTKKRKARNLVRPSQLLTMTVETRDEVNAAFAQLLAIETAAKAWSVVANGPAEIADRIFDAISIVDLIDAIIAGKGPTP